MAFKSRKEIEQIIHSRPENVEHRAFYAQPINRKALRNAIKIGRALPKCMCDKPQTRCPIHDTDFTDAEIL